MEDEILSRIQRRILRALLDMLILVQLKNGSKSGPDIIRFVNAKFNVQLSSGTVYSSLYALERDDLIKAEMRHRKRFFVLTDNGEKISRAVLDSYRELSNYLAYLVITSLGIEKP